MSAPASGREPPHLRRHGVNSWTFCPDTLSGRAADRPGVAWRLAGIGATILGARGVVDLAEQVIIGALVALALGVGALLFTMRQQDLKIHQELRRRRLSRPG